MTILYEMLLLLILITILIYIVKKNSELTLLLIWIIVIPVLLQTISLILINKGMYVSELNLNTYNNNSGIIFQLILIWFLLCIGSFFFLNRKKYNNYFRSISLLSNRQENVNIYVNSYRFVNLLYVLLLYLFADLFVHGIPLFNQSYGIKLGYFRTGSHFPFVRTIYSIVCLYSPSVLGYFLILYKEKIYKVQKVKIYILIILSLLYSYLIGFKVSGIDIILFLPFVTLCISYFYKNKNNKFHISYKGMTVFLWISIIICIFIMGIFFNYSKTVTNAENTNLMDYFLQRTFGLSNHLFWAAKNYFDNGNVLNSSIIWNNLCTELNSIIVQPSTTDTNFGIAKLMMYLGNPATVNFYLQHGVVMSGSFITVFYFNCGPFITCGIAVIVAAIFEKLIRIFVEAISRKSIIEMLISTKLLYSFYSFVWNSGSITTFLSVANILLIIFLYILKHYKSLSKDRLVV